VRFSGLVVGFAALGAVLFSSVAGDVLMSFPSASSTEQAQITLLITNGNLSGAAQVLANKHIDTTALTAIIAHGYQMVMSVAAAIASIALVLTWWLTDATETAPHLSISQGTADVLID
jgi:hypothetical protein